MTDFKEDPLYLSKDTKVFIICNPHDMYAMVNKNRQIREFQRFGYTNISVQYYVKLDQINNSPKELGIDINVKKEEVGVDAVYLWYTFANVLRKGRILGKHFIVAFTPSYLTKDISRKNLTKDKMYHPNNMVVMNAAAADDILNTIQNFDVPRTITAETPLRAIQQFNLT